MLLDTLKRARALFQDLGVSLAGHESDVAKQDEW